MSITAERQGGDARAGRFTAVFARGADAAAFLARITGQAGSPYTSQPDAPGAWYARDARVNRKGGRTVTWAYDGPGPLDGPAWDSPDAPPRWHDYWVSMAETVGFYGSTFGEPPWGAGARTATLNGRACPASM
jgi:hypothetical protein